MNSASPPLPLKLENTRQREALREQITMQLETEAEELRRRLERWGLDWQVERARVREKAS
jgi:hypothetical protein